jgi:hypothetical protein
MAVRSKPVKPIKRKKGWQGPGPGRKRLGSKHVMLTLNKALLAELDEWMAAQPTGLLYPQAVRELMQQSLARWRKNRARQ